MPRRTHRTTPAGRCALVDLLIDAFGDLLATFVGSDDRVDTEIPGSDGRRDKGTRRRPHDDFGIVRMPTRGHVDGEKGGEVIGGSGDTPTAEYKTYSAHGSSGYRLDLALGLFHANPAGRIIPTIWTISAGCSTKCRQADRHAPIGEHKYLDLIRDEPLLSIGVRL